ncbi:MAG TPA: hypothetical protein VIE14_04355, partial [Steroidobacteraceae bacterium]
FRGQDLMLRSLGAQPAVTLGWDLPAPSPWGRFTNWWASRFFKPQATVNLFARLESQLSTLAAVEPANSARLRDWGAGSEAAFAPSWVRFSYNPVGKVHAAIAPPAMRTYPLRAFDGAALQRLVRLGYEIRRQGIADPEIPAFMAQHPEWATHPGDAHPFLWNPPTRVLSLRPLAPQSRERRFAIPVWGATARD